MMNNKEIEKIRGVVSRLNETDDFKEFLSEIERSKERVKRNLVGAEEWEEVLKLQGEYQSYKRILAYGGQANTTK